MREAVFFVIVAGAAAMACAGRQDGVARPPSAGPPRAGARARPSYPLADGAAQVCVVRPETLASEVSMPVRDNGRLVGATRGTTYVCWLAATGEHQITSVDDDTGPILLEARSGARYWLHQEVMELAGAVHAHLDWVDDDTAADMIDGCESRVRVAVPGHEEEPGAMTIAPAKARR